MKTKVNIIGCGGTGVNILSKLKKGLESLGDGFAEVNIKFIDTSKTSIQKFQTEEEIAKNFFLVEEASHSKDKIDGSGGERSTNVESISIGVKKFLDENKIKERVTGESYIVLGSGSSGTGSVLSPLIVKALLERDIPVVVILIGDSGNHMYSISTKNTIATFSNIAKQLNKPINMAYANNATIDGEDLATRYEMVDKLVFRFISVFALFMSGQNSDIDYQDMLGLIDPTMFKSINIPAGLYGISTYLGKDIKLPQYIKPVIGRSLTADKVDAIPNIDLHHHKVGEILVENAYKIYSKHLPVHLVTHMGSYTHEVEIIDEKIRQMEEALNSLEVETIQGTTEADDNGLII